ncbi:hypothetical protein [Mesorhizobium muleiense]|uniref:hypothetical protein n=1 Tax=Mesorhizobium muleiense TaxID=1004279 RepID=UPI001F3F6A6B|nr:hypothetical protein [Mesorhizobium muleiense]MCF6108485.1 hypothetical protein [Mesorhizobium muleiense]
MIIDCHGHYTSQPQDHHVFRKAQVEFVEGTRHTRPAYPDIADEVLRATIEQNQLRLQRERGSDLTILSPRASGIGHISAAPTPMPSGRASPTTCNDMTRQA